MKKNKSSLPLNLVLLFVSAAAAYAAYNAVRQTTEFYRESKDTDTKIQVLAARKIELERKIDELKTTEAMERSAKERFNMKKTGETVVVVVPEDENKDINPKSVGWWGKIKNFFLRK